MSLAIQLEFGQHKPIGSASWGVLAPKSGRMGNRVNRVPSRSKPIISFGSLDRYRDLSSVRYQYGIREPRRRNRYRDIGRTAYLHGSEPEPPGPGTGPKSIFIACAGIQPLRNRGPPVLSVAYFQLLTLISF